MTVQPHPLAKVALGDFDPATQLEPCEVTRYGRALGRWIPADVKFEIGGTVTKSHVEAGVRVIDSVRVNEVSLRHRQPMAASPTNFSLEFRPAPKPTKAAKPKGRGR